VFDRARGEQTLGQLELELEVHLLGRVGNKTSSVILEHSFTEPEIQLGVAGLVVYHPEYAKIQHMFYYARVETALTIFNSLIVST